MAKRFSKNDVDFLIKNYSTNGPQFCAKRLNRSEQSIIHKAHRLKLQVSLNRFKQTCKESALKFRSTYVKPIDLYKVDPRPFLNIQDKEISYILGFMWADGYINNHSRSHRISMKIIKKDFDDIEPLYDKYGKWSKYIYHDIGKQLSIAVSTNNKILYNFLKENDYKVKSYVSPSKILSKIPRELAKYFWRGYIDGDGCFTMTKTSYSRQFSLCGSLNQDWFDFEYLLKSLNIKYNISKNISDTGNSSKVRICNKNDLLKLGSYIYESNYDGIGLKRKFDKFIEIINSYIY